MSGFRPTPGRLDVLQPAGGPFTRVDSGFQQGDTIPPHYDSLIAKLIVWAPDRAAAITRMTRALDEFRVAGPGVCTTIGLARQLVNAPLFVAAGHTTTTADELLAQWQAAS
jgi:acetyl-CoA carboxylase biotin carboxylase subunit